MRATASTTGLACRLVRGAEEIERELRRYEPRRLLAVTYGRSSPDGMEVACPLLHVPNRVLREAPAAELWLSAGPVKVGRRSEVAWAEDGRLLAGCLGRSVRCGEDLEAAANEQFAVLLELLAERGYEHPIRIWNYVPAINEGAGDAERYRLFNRGRARAFEDRFGAEGRDWRAPASSAVGTRGGELLTAFLARRAPVVLLENPRQAEARCYPLRFGPRAPSFSRASLFADGDGASLFLSGTASIVGCDSVHSGSLAEQTAETLRNVDAVLASARSQAKCPLPPLAGFDLVKVYLRRGAALDEALSALSGRLAPDSPLLLIEADICRRELLVEIEGVALA